MKKMRKDDVYIYESCDVISIEEDDSGNKQVKFIGFAFQDEREEETGEDRYPFVIATFVKYCLPFKDVLKRVKKYEDGWYKKAVAEYDFTGNGYWYDDASIDEVVRFYTDENGCTLPEIYPEDIDKKTPVGKYIVC